MLKVYNDNGVLKTMPIFVYFFPPTWFPIDWLLAFVTDFMGNAYIKLGYVVVLSIQFIAYIPDITSLICWIHKES